MRNCLSPPRAVCWRQSKLFSAARCARLLCKILLFEKADPSLVSIKIELTGHLGVNLITGKTPHLTIKKD